MNDLVKTLMRMEARNRALSRNWWAFLLRGVLALSFAMAALTWPAETLAGLLGLLAAYLIVDGGCALLAGVRRLLRHERWWCFALQGTAGLLAGAAVLAMPGLSALALAWLVAGWAMVSGVFALLAARGIGRRRGRLWQVLSGTGSILLGALIVAIPGLGPVALMTLLGLYALPAGALAVALALRLHDCRPEEEGARAPAPAARRIAGPAGW